MIICHCHNRSLKDSCYVSNINNTKIISLENILNRPQIILIGQTTENFVKLIKGEK
jgi:hypothetical protein